MLIALIAAVMGQTVIKFGFNRPRFRTLTDPDAQFTYWFVHHPFILDSSFPSGHAAQSALAFLLLYLKRFIPKLRTRKWDAVLGGIAVFVTVSTMLSRMFLGAHYATDVWAGCFLTLGTISVANRCVENSYMLPNYRLNMIREKALQLCGMNSTTTTHTILWFRNWTRQTWRMGKANWYCSLLRYARMWMPCWGTAAFPAGNGLR